MPKRGFTLIEIVMATVILSVVMLGLVSVFVSAKKIIRHSRARITAAEAGKALIEALSSDCIYAKNCANQTITIANQTYTANYTIENLPAPVQDIYRVKTVINWTEND